MIQNTSFLIIYYYISENFCWKDVCPCDGGEQYCHFWLLGQIGILK